MSTHKEQLRAKIRIDLTLLGVNFTEEGSYFVVVANLLGTEMETFFDEDEIRFFIAGLRYAAKVRG